MMAFTLVMLLLVIGAVWNFNYQLNKLKERHEEELRKQVTIARKDAKKRSASVQWGVTIENFVPFMTDFPIPAENVNFLGKPIDYIGYTDTDSKEDCAVHFIEVKSGKSQLLKHQRNIRDAIKNGRVCWHEIRVESNEEL